MKTDQKDGGFETKLHKKPFTLYESMDKYEAPKSLKIHGFYSIIFGQF